MTDWTIDEGDAETDEMVLGAINQNIEIRDTRGDEPGRTLRLDRMEREGLIQKVWWYEITTKAQEVLDAQRDKSEKKA